MPMNVRQFVRPSARVRGVSDAVRRVPRQTGGPFGVRVGAVRWGRCPAADCSTLRSVCVRWVRIGGGADRVRDSGEGACIGDADDVAVPEAVASKVDRLPALAGEDPQESEWHMPAPGLPARCASQARCADGRAELAPTL